MKNSIEEDITKIEGLKYLTLQATIKDKFICAKIPDDYIQALEHILSDYKRVLKENEQLKNNTRKNENELEFDVDGDWIALQKILDESEKNNEYISYKNEKWINEKYCILVQEVKDKVEELKEQYNVRELDFIKTTQDIRNIIIQSLEELIEGKN